MLIFAIILPAFWLSDLRNQHIERRASNLALEAVVNKIRQKKSILERWTPRHREMFERSEHAHDAHNNWFNLVDDLFTFVMENFDHAGMPPIGRVSVSPG